MLSMTLKTHVNLDVRCTEFAIKTEHFRIQSILKEGQVSGNLCTLVIYNDTLPFCIQNT